jgi:NhaP-type Na+/H+ or K+/H+ antiporter
MERTPLLTVSLALSLTVLGVCELAGMNGVLAAFVAGWSSTRLVVATLKSARRRSRKP